MIRRKQETKPDWIRALSEIGDEALGVQGFKRLPMAMKYTRKFKEAKHVLDFTPSFSPRYQPDAELHIYPHMHFSIKAVCDTALDLVAGDKWLLANAPNTIMNEPIESAAPKSQHVRWFATGAKEMRERLIEILRFADRWVLPFLNELGTVDDLLRVYREGDSRMAKQRNQYIFFAAAELLNDNPRAALSVLEDNLGSPAMRSIFAKAYESLYEKLKESSEN